MTDRANHLPRATLLCAALCGGIGAIALGGCGQDEISASGDLAIIGGVPTDDYPAVGLVSTGCTGTVVHPHMVLTASHCCHPNPSACRSFELGEHTFDVLEAILHPNYEVLEGGGITPSYDVAILLLKQPVTHVEPMPLSTSDPEIGKDIDLVGFGCTSFEGPGFGTKRHGHNTIEFFGQDSGGGDTERFADVFAWTATDTFEDANICPGDSGGPTLWDEGPTTVVAGVHTLVGPTVGYSTNVSARLDFIDSNTPECSIGDTEPCDECTETLCGPDLTMGSTCVAISPAPPGCAGSGPDAGTAEEDSSGGCNLGTTRSHTGTTLLALLLVIAWSRRKGFGPPQENAPKGD